MQARNLWLCFVMGGRGSVISHINSESLSFIGFSIRYSQATNTMVHKCSCCQEIKTSNRRVTLTCSDGTSLDHSYSSVEKCSCEGAECITQDNTQQETRQIKTSTPSLSLTSEFLFHWFFNLSWSFLFSSFYSLAFPERLLCLPTPCNEVLDIFRLTHLVLVEPLVCSITHRCS